MKNELNISGVMNDLGSGGNVDICVITAGKKEHIRSFRSPCPRLFKAEFPRIQNGTTPLIDPKENLFKTRVIVQEGDTLDKDGDVKM